MEHAIEPDGGEFVWIKHDFVDPPKVPDILPAISAFGVVGCEKFCDQWVGEDAKTAELKGYWEEKKLQGRDDGGFDLC